MARTRGPQAPADEDLFQRSKRKRAASSGDNLESTSAGQGTNEGKRVLYHCNYCNKDISGKIRMKCGTCPDFDLCVECFSVGAEVHPHKSNHPYRVMENLSVSLICQDWNAEEEILLLEGLEMYGFGNWAEVAEHVGTKSKAQCIDHYTNAYMNSPCFPLPDMSHVVGKNRKELLAMPEVQEFPTLGELTLKEEPTLSPSKVKIEEAAVGRSPSRLTADAEAGVGCSSSYAASTGAVKSNIARIKDGPNAIRVEDRSVGVEKPISFGDEGPSMAELRGYNPKRQEFNPAYDNDAEQALADMEFKDTDTEAEHELKLQMLRIYGKRIDERKRRTDFILERNLLHPDPLEKDLSPEEREIYNQYKVFMRFLSKEEHDELIKTIIEKHRIRKRIQELQEARDAGCRTSSEAERYLEQKRREAEESAQKGKGSTSVDAGGMDQPSTTAGLASSSSLDVWDITGLPGSDLLSESEKRLCEEIKLIPSHYLKMLETMSIEIFKGSLTKKSDAHSLFEVDPSKVDRVYDMLVRKGIAPPPV